MTDLPRPGGRRYATGIALGLLGGLCLSFGGLLFRQIEEGQDWRILFYRSASLAVGILIVTLVRERRDTVRAFRAIGLPGLAGGLILGAGLVCYVLALLNTTIANALFPIAAMPLFAALAGLVLLREAVRPVTWVAILIAAAGITLMVQEEISLGRSFGNVMALLAALTLALYAVCVRFRPGTDMSPALVLSGVSAATFAAGAAYLWGDGLAMAWDELLLCLFMGGVQATLGFYLLTAATRYVPAAEMTLLALAEVILGPIWVLAFIGEQPSLNTLIGGAVVLLAVAGFATASIKARGRGRSDVAPDSALVPRPPGARRAHETEEALAFALARASQRELGAPARPAEAAVDARRERLPPPRPVAVPPPRPAPPAAQATVADLAATLEARLRDRLRPELRGWVEQNLPRIAESMVRDEVRRVVRRAESTAED